MAPTQFPVIGMEDLAAFQQAAGQNNMYSLLGGGINSARFDQRTWAPETSAVSNFAQAFLGSALGQFGRQQVAQQTRDVAAMLPQLYANPGAVAAPEGVDSTAFETLRSLAAVKQVQRQAALDALTADLLGEGQKQAMLKRLEAGMSGEAEYNKIMGQRRAWDEISGQGAGSAPTGQGAGGTPDISNMHPDDPRRKNMLDQQKLSDDLRKELNARPELKSFTEVSNRFNVLKKALGDPNAISDYEFAVGLAKIFDPTSVVRESETGTIVQGQNIPSQLLGSLNQAVSGGPKLDIKTRLSLLEAAARAYGTQKVDVDSILNQYAGIASDRGLPKEQILPSFGSKFQLDDAAKKQLAKQFPATEEGFRQFERAVSILGM